jgi:hypothetical protein
MTSRRAFIHVAIISTLAANSSTAFAAVDQLSAAVTSLRILSNNDASFKAILDRDFPGLTSSRRFQKLLRHTALLINSTAQPVYGYTVRWQTVRSGAVKEEYRRRFLRRPSVALKARASTASVPFLLPGESAVVTPVATFTSSDYSRRFANKVGRAGKNLTPLGPRKWNSIKERYPVGFGLVERTLTTDTVTVSLDAVVFRNSVAGPKKESTSRALRYHQNAEIDEAKRLYSSSVSRAGTLVVPTLLKNIERSIWISRRRNGELQSPYSLSRANFAKKIRFAVNRGETTRVAQILVDTMKHPRGVLI